MFYIAVKCKNHCYHNFCLFTCISRLCELSYRHALCRLLIFFLIDVVCSVLFHMCCNACS